MQTFYIRVKLKAPATQPSTAPVPTSRKVKGKVVKSPGVAGANVPLHTHDVVVRTVQAEDLGHACRAGEAQLDVLAVLETSAEPLT